MKNVQVFTSDAVYAFTDVEDVFNDEDGDVTVVVDGESHFFTDVDTLSLMLTD